MSQFWQKKQPMLQPAVPIERIFVAGKEVVQRLLLDRIHGNRRGASVAELQQPSAFILADEAEAVLAFADVAMARAKIAVETPVGHGLPPAGFVNLRL